MAFEKQFLIAGLLLMAVSFAVFSIRQLAFGRSHHPRVQQDGGSFFFGGTYLMEFAYWLLQPVVNALIFLRVSPNQISLFCLLISIGSGVAFGFGEFLWAGLLWTFGSSFDALDGLVARQQNRVSKAGSVIDSTVDRVAEMSVFSGLAVYYRGEAWILTLILVALGVSFLTSYVSAKGDILNVKLPRGVMRRAERAVYIGLAALISPFINPLFVDSSYYDQHPLMITVLFLIAVFAGLSCVYRMHWLVKKLEE